MQQFPTTRLRRLRAQAGLRRLVEEHQLAVSDLVYPIFICEGEVERQAIPQMPGQYRVNLSGALALAGQCIELGVPALALFPYIEPQFKSLDAAAAYADDGLVVRVLAAIKQQYPELIVVTDVALDPYTLHGQDGLLDPTGYVANDVTVAVLVEQALAQARAGADIIAPSDMMDGRIGAIRQALEAEGFQNTVILSYAAKYASGFYGPFRQAVGSIKNLNDANKYTYQMNPANSMEALREVELDLAEGADCVMVKPGLPYLDVVANVKKTFKVPTFVYQVSGEYAMLKFAVEHGCLNERQAVLESLLSMKRAGADAIFTYFALDVARYLRDE